jgi:hypothetical protein
MALGLKRAGFQGAALDYGAWLKKVLASKALR